LRPPIRVPRNPRIAEMGVNHHSRFTLWRLVNMVPEINMAQSSWEVQQVFWPQLVAK